MSQSYRRKTEHKSCALSIIFAGFMVFAICVAFLKRGAYEPFGNNTLAVMDAKYQYLDFYSFLRDGRITLPILSANSSAALQ